MHFHPPMTRLPLLIAVVVAEGAWLLPRLPLMSLMFQRHFHSRCACLRACLHACLHAFLHASLGFRCLENQRRQTIYLLGTQNQSQNQNQNQSQNQRQNQSQNQRQNQSQNQNQPQKSVGGVGQEEEGGSSEDLPLQRCQSPWQG